MSRVGTNLREGSKSELEAGVSLGILRVVELSVGVPWPNPKQILEFVKVQFIIFVIQIFEDALSFAVDTSPQNGHFVKRYRPPQRERFDRSIQKYLPIFNFFALVKM